MTALLTFFVFRKGLKNTLFFTKLSPISLLNLFMSFLVCSIIDWIIIVYAVIKYIQTLNV